MALILALNPGNSHTPTLARLARELKGVELIGADSCPTAIKAIKERVPDLVLLPAKQAPGEADLIAQLKKVPGGVLTVKLPPVEQADPVDIAQQIREILTGVGAASPKPATVERAAAGASPQLIAAATAAIGWIRARRAQWSEPQEAYATHAAYAAHEPEEPEYYEPIPLSDEPEEIVVPRQAYAPPEPDEPEGPSVIERAAETAADVGGTVVSWLPRIAALVVVLGVAAALVSFWPQISGAISSTVQQFDTPDEPAQPAATSKPAPAQPAAKPAAEPDPLGKVSGWVAVFAPFEITISEGSAGVPLDDRGRAMLTPGRHRLRFQNRELGYDETRTVQVRPTETTTINLTPETTITVTSNEPAEVLIDGTRAGDTPFEGRVGLGTHTVTVRTAGGERQRTVAATSKPVQLEVDFSKP
ncbi:MAG TPA: hypothetical protein VFO48_00385 [Vicinamibacterales bacterium]|nr:hypothetical protein [Vicinamibacterales bacterium]